MSSPSVSTSPDDVVPTHQNQDEEEKRFLHQLKSIGVEPYFFRQSNIYASWHRERFEKILQYRNHPITDPINLGTVKHYNYLELQRIINSFDESNMVCQCLCGKLFHGTIQTGSMIQDVLVKTWEFSFPGKELVHYNLPRFHDEVICLRDPRIKSHPHVVNLIGFHCDEKLAVIYEGKKPKYILEDIISSDILDWDDRMKVAIQIGSALRVFHEQGFVLGAVEPYSIMIDEEKSCAQIFDFGLQTYSEIIQMTYYPYSVMAVIANRRYEEYEDVKWTMWDDIFSYGILLLLLIAREKPCYKFLGYWAAFLMPNPPKSVVNEAFNVEEDVASGITKLAFDCMKGKPDERPSVKAIVDSLEKILSGPAVKKQKLCGN